MTREDLLNDQYEEKEVLIGTIYTKGSFVVRQGTDGVWRLSTENEEHLGDVESLSDINRLKADYMDRVAARLEARAMVARCGASLLRNPSDDREGKNHAALNAAGLTSYARLLKAEENFDVKSMTDEELAKADAVLSALRFKTLEELGLRGL